MAVYHIRTNGFMLPEHKATEFYRTADDFCKEFVLLRNLLIIEYPPKRTLPKIHVTPGQISLFFILPTRILYINV